MDEDIIYDSPFATLLYHPDKKIVKYYNALGITAKFLTEVDKAMHRLESV